ncbi:MAG TPA: DUF3131 domain-containing protein [Anaeromyxobacteraceae bacterium]|nr:DUF3131 domain-containing protein [Anaeromyxobacteraceae bacterium]
MTFLSGLLAARSHLAFLVGLAAAIAVVRLTARAGGATQRPTGFEALGGLAEQWRPRRDAPLSHADREMARAAWAYFQRNTDGRTGLASSVRGYPSTTMWDTGSQLMAVLAAQDLGLISRAEARRRLERALKALTRLPLCEGVPNKAYDTRTLEMVDYGNHPRPDGIGWSALDLGRLFVPLTLIVRREPALTPLVERLAARWDLAALGDGSALRGATRRERGRLETYQEGRLGYEQYAARALFPWGVDVGRALDYRAHASLVAVEGQLVPADDRQPRDHGGTHNAVVSEPWVLEGLERGFDATTGPLARGVFAAQAQRAVVTNRLTATSEDALDRPPGFSYSAVLNGGVAWTAFWPDGTPAPGDLTFSAKAAAGWAALFEGSYPDRLHAAAEALVVPGEGVYAGRYDATGEVNRVLSLGTNAVVLEALAYRLKGPFLRRSGAPGGAEVRR